MDIIAKLKKQQSELEKKQQQEVNNLKEEENTLKEEIAKKEQELDNKKQSLTEKHSEETVKMQEKIEKAEVLTNKITEIEEQEKEVKQAKEEAEEKLIIAEKTMQNLNEQKDLVEEELQTLVICSELQDIFSNSEKPVDDEDFDLSDGEIDNLEIYDDYPEEDTKLDREGLGKGLLIGGGCVILAGILVFAGYKMAKRGGKTIVNDPLTPTTQSDTTSQDKLAAFDPSDEKQLTERATILNEQISSVKGVKYSTEQVKDLIRVLNGITPEKENFTIKNAVQMLEKIESANQRDAINTVNVEKPNGNYTPIKYEVLFGYDNYMGVKHFTNLRNNALTKVVNGEDYTSDAQALFEAEVAYLTGEEESDSILNQNSLSDEANLFLNAFLLKQSNLFLKQINNGKDFVSIKDYYNDKNEENSFEEIRLDRLIETTNDNSNYYGNQILQNAKLCLEK